MLHDNFSTFHLQHQEGFKWLVPPCPHPQVGDKSFVTKQANCFPKMAQNTHTMGTF